MEPTPTPAPQPHFRPWTPPELNAMLSPSTHTRLLSTPLTNLHLPQPHERITLFTLQNDGYACFRNDMNFINKGKNIDRPTMEAAFWAHIRGIACRIQPGSVSERFGKGEGKGREQVEIWNLVAGVMLRMSDEESEAYWVERERLVSGLDISCVPFDIDRSEEVGAEESTRIHTQEALGLDIILKREMKVYLDGPGSREVVVQFAEEMEVD